MHISGTVSIGIGSVQAVITAEYTQHVRLRTTPHQLLIMETKTASEILNTDEFNVLLTVYHRNVIS
jgi:hypothetical protein